MIRLITATTLLAMAVPAFAGKYDFSYSNLEHLKGSYQMCEKMGFSGNGPDCPMVYNACWSKYTYHQNGKLKTKCKKASNFTGTEVDAQEAISDATVLRQQQPQ